MKKIILASASPRRQELLKQIGVDFIVVPSNYEETIEDNQIPEELAQKLAVEKALHVARTVQEDALIIGADTIVIKDRILGKPSSPEQAFEMLKFLQGGWHDVITGVAIVDAAGMKQICGFEKTRVKMRSLTDESINSYIRTGEPFDKAGSYGIQGLGALLVEKIDGCYFNVVGLPLTRLGRMLEEFSIKLL